MEVSYSRLQIKYKRLVRSQSEHIVLEIIEVMEKYNLNNNNLQKDT